MNMRLTPVAAALCAAAIALPAAAKEFRSSDVHPDDYPTVMAVKYMSDIIKQKTGGKDSIKVYTMSQLGSEKDTIEQTKIGALDFVRINVAPMNNICPETMVPTMPFLFKSKEHMRKVLDGPIGDEILKACEKQGFIGLAFYDSGSRSLYTVKKPVKTHRRRQGHEDPRPAVGPVGRAAAGDGRQRDADSLRRGLYGAQDRRGRRRGEQLAVVRHRAPLSKSRSTTRSPITRWRPRCCSCRRRCTTG